MKIGVKYGLDDLICEQIEESWKNRWMLKYLSSEDQKNTIVRWPYTIPACKGFEVEVGDLPDGEYSLSCGDNTKQATKTLKSGKTITIYGTKNRVFSVKNNIVMYPVNPSNPDDLYYDGKKANLPNFGNPVRGAVTPELNIPVELLSSEWLGRQEKVTSLPTINKNLDSFSTNNIGLKLDDYVLEDILGGSKYRIVDCGEGRFMIHYSCAQCGDMTELALRPKIAGEFEG